MMLRYLILFSVAVLSILRPSHVKQVNAASVTTKMKATTAVALVGFTALQQVNAGYDCTNAPTGDPNTQCGKNQCCSASETCSGLDNASCPTFDSNINVSCEGCCGSSACDQASDATVGVKSCNGDYSCDGASGSNIGDHSCRGYQSCQNTGSKDSYAIIGDNSCNNEYACINCSTIQNRATVPSNSCNEAGWIDKTKYNICPYCKYYCKIQATGESCNVSIFSFVRILI